MRPRFHAAARQSPDEHNGLRVPYAPGKRQIPRWRWYAILLVVFSPLLYFASKAIYSVFIVSATGYVSLEQFEVRSSVRGIIRKLHVEVGDEIEAGATLAELDDPLLRERELKYVSELDRSHNGSAPAIARAEEVLAAQVKLAQKILDDRTERYQVVRNLFEQHAATLGEVREARGSVDDARADLNRARHDLAVSYEAARRLAEPRRRDTDKRIRTELELIEFSRSQLLQKAAYAGRIIDVYAQEGEVVDAGVPLLLIGLPERPRLIAYLDPRYADRVHNGKAATVSFPDGGTIQANVVRPLEVTKRLPAELVGPLGVRHMAVLLRLTTDSGLPKRYRVHGLPMSIRFHFSWEQGVREVLSMDNGIKSSFTR
jgi:multidrug resistance efflux pump